MAVDISIPRLGTVKSDATIVEWNAKEGDPVEKGGIVLVIETQKIKFDVVAEASGFLHIIVEEGVQCPVGTIVGAIAESPEELQRLQEERPLVSNVDELTPRISAAATEPTAPEGPTPPRAKTEERGAIRISPVARKMAEEHMIDIGAVTGTGPDGRIVREDIERAMAAKEAPAVEKSGEPEAAGGKKVLYTVPLKGMRGAIAEHLHRSLQESAQLTAMGEIDMTELVKLRREFIARESLIGAKITYNDIFVLVAARVLREKPLVNSSIIGNEIRVWDDINIGIAVALDEGLIVPVIKQADKKSISAISGISKDLVERAKKGKLMPDDVSDGTFTVTNLGAAGAGWRFETSIINPPESAILGTGGITDRAVVRDGQIVIRPIMTYGFTYDHRVIDGATAVQFMTRVIELLENPGLLIL